MGASNGAESLYADFDEPLDDGSSSRWRAYFIGLILSVLLTVASLGILGSKLWIMYQLGSTLTPSTALAGPSVHR